jgi:phage baseplate assembly protein gpV
MTQQEALEAVRQATTDYVAAVEADELDAEDTEWLEWLQRRSVVHALDAGCPPAGVKSAVIKAVEEVVACRV